MIHVFRCAGCHEKIEAAEVPSAVVVHPSPRLWSLTHTLHADADCIKRYLGGQTIGELEASLGVFVVPSAFRPGFARIVDPILDDGRIEGAA